MSAIVNKRYSQCNSRICIETNSLVRPRYPNAFLNTPVIVLMAFNESICFTHTATFYIFALRKTFYTAVDSSHLAKVRYEIKWSNGHAFRTYICRLTYLFEKRTLNCSCKAMLNLPRENFIVFVEGWGWIFLISWIKNIYRGRVGENLL